VTVLPHAPAGTPAIPLVPRVGMRELRLLPDLSVAEGPISRMNALIERGVVVMRRGAAPSGTQR
jgi:hypothetical protein